MPRKIILSSPEKRNYEKFFGKGLSIAGNILLALKDAPKNFEEGLPSYYGFDIAKKIYYNPNKKPKLEINKNTLRTNLRRLKEKGLITKNPKQKVFVLTQEGKKIIMQVENRLAIFQRPWDGKLRLVFFDIPEKKKLWRNWLRSELINLRFQKIQESVYAGKYPLPQSFYEEINQQGINECVFIITAGEIDKQESILKVLER